MSKFIKVVPTLAQRIERADMHIEEKALLFRALGHRARLIIINLLYSKPRHGEELAVILKLKPATVSHHLAKLAEIGLVTSYKDQYYQMYALVDGVLEKSLAEVIQLPQTGLDDKVEMDAFQQKVINTYFRYGRLTLMPKQLKKRKIILERLAEEFELEKDYHELEVNRILKQFFDDVATLRREMVMEGIMSRVRNTYRRA